ncbi:MAG: transposase [Spirochaetaceae bacterium]|jgi:REP element-mobilizing transposase RayT|nr:transposase [Spirochaetaceae bacterium]
MRPLRVLQRGIWYGIHTRINNREPLFRHPRALALFTQVFRETKQRFVFQIRSLQLADDGLRFYIKPADGRELPAIMKWLKQVFAQRYNHACGRSGHIWGDRYASWILAGAPPVEDVGAGTGGTRVRPYSKEAAPYPFFSPLFPFPRVPAPG